MNIILAPVHSEFRLILCAQSFEGKTELLLSFVLGTGGYFHQLCHGAIETHWERSWWIY